MPGHSGSSQWEHLLQFFDSQLSAQIESQKEGLEPTIAPAFDQDPGPKWQLEIRLLALGLLACSGEFFGFDALFRRMSEGFSWVVRVAC